MATGATSFWTHWALCSRRGKTMSLFPSADPQLVDMLNTWAALRPRDQLPQIHVRTCWSTANMPFSSYGGGFVNVVRRLSDICPNANLSAETPAGAALLVSETGLEVGFCPHLIEEETLNVALPAKAPERLYVGWLGDPRPEKGAGIIAEIIGKALQGYREKRSNFSSNVADANLERPVVFTTSWRNLEMPSSWCLPSILERSTRICSSDAV